MNSDKIYRVIVIGPTGAGKSQFCNFVRRDKSNSINKVSDSLDSCTQDPFSNTFPRQSTNYEFIDTAGNSDSSNNDIINLEKLVNYLKQKKSIDYIILLLKFNERVTNDTRKYIETLGKIFTPGEFFNHLCIFFTKFPAKPSKKEEKIKNKSKEEINGILKDTFKIERNMGIPVVNVYFIDTEVDEDTEEYEENSQETIDIMLKNLKLKVEMNGSIDTQSLDITGKSVDSRIEAQQKQIKQIQEMLELEKKKREKEKLEKEKLKREIENEKINNELKKRKEKELEEINKRLNEERKRLEEIDRINRIKAEENLRKQKLIEEEAKKKGIKIEHLDNILDGCGDLAGKSFKGIGIGASLIGGLIILGNVAGGILFPPAAVAEAVAYFGLGIGAISTVTLGGSAVVATCTKVHKEIIK